MDRLTKLYSPKLYSRRPQHGCCSHNCCHISCNTKPFILHFMNSFCHFVILQSCQQPQSLPQSQLLGATTFNLLLYIVLKLHYSAVFDGICHLTGRLLITMISLLVFHRKYYNLHCKNGKSRRRSINHPLNTRWVVQSIIKKHIERICNSRRMYYDLSNTPFLCQNNFRYNFKLG